MEKVEVAIPFDLEELFLYRRGAKQCVYYPVRWKLRQGRGKWGEFPLVVAREHYRRLGYQVLASEPRLKNGEGFILLSYPGYRKARHPAYMQMSALLSTNLVALDELNEIADRAKIAATGNRGGGDPDLFVYKPGTSEKFFVEVKYKDRLNAKQLVTFPIIRKHKWEVRIARIVAAD